MALRGWPADSKVPEYEYPLDSEMESKDQIDTVQQDAGSPPRRGRDAHALHEHADERNFAVSNVEKLYLCRSLILGARDL
jgi:hypothetical protein